MGNKNQDIKKSVLILFIVLIAIISPDESLAENLIIKEEEVIWGYSRNFETPSIYKNGILKLNFTNLANSESAVNITRDPNGDNYCTWMPFVPLNFTLAPGESYCETFELLDYSTETGGYVVFGCSTIVEDSSATLRLESLVIKKGVKASGFLFIGTSMGIVLISAITKAKKKRK